MASNSNLLDVLSSIMVLPLSELFRVKILAVISLRTSSLLGLVGHPHTVQLGKEQ